MKNLIFLGFLILAVQAASDYNLIKLTDSADAKCLDGTPPAIYYSKGREEKI